MYARVEGTLFGMAGYPSSRDVTQGELDNCYFASALSVLADMFPHALKQSITPHGDSWQVSFQVPGRVQRGRSVATTGVQSVLVDNKFYLRKPTKPGSKGKRRVKGQSSTATCNDTIYMRLVSGHIPNYQLRCYLTQVTDRFAVATAAGEGMDLVLGRYGV